MTATVVDGVPVLASEPWPSPIKGMGGQTLYFKQIVRLLLADEREMAGCAHCDFASPNWQSIRPHLRGCKVKKAKEAAQSSATNEAPQPVWMQPATPTIKARKDWPAADKAKAQPAPARPVRPAQSSRMPIDLQAILDRLAQIPELEQRNRHLEAEVARWRDEAMELRRFVNPLLTRIDGIPRRSNAKVVMPAQDGRAA